MRSTQPKLIIVDHPIGCGGLPAFMSFIIRHFQKELPKPLGESEHVAEYRAPVDLLGMTSVSKDLLDDVEEVRLGFKKPIKP